MGSVMDDLVKSIVPLKRTIDDAMDEGELLPNRYQNMLVQPELPL